MNLKIEKNGRHINLLRKVKLDLTIIILRSVSFIWKTIRCCNGGNSKGFMVNNLLKLSLTELNAVCLIVIQERP